MANKTMTFGKAASTTEGVDIKINGSLKNFYTLSNVNGVTNTATPKYVPSKWYVSTGITLETGTTIVIKTPHNGNANGVWVSVGGDNADNYHPLVVNVNTLVTTQYGAGCILHLVYDASQSASVYALAGADKKASVTGVWKAQAYYDTNTQLRIYKDETSTYPLIGSRSAASSITSGSTGVYGEISATNAITMTPSSGTITATTFSGALDGNAKSATKATQDGDGNVIASTYLPLSGGTMTGPITFKGNQSSAWNDQGILFTNGSRIGENNAGGLGIYGDSIYLRPNSLTSSKSAGMIIQNNNTITPGVNNTITMGTSSLVWKNIYSTDFTGTNVSATSKIVVTNAPEDTGGILLQKNNKKYAGMFIKKLGTAPSGDTPGEVGLANLYVGNATANTDTTNGADNAKGQLYIYGTNTHANVLVSNNTSASTHSVNTLPAATGWVAIGGNGSTTGVGSTTRAIYLDTNGVLKQADAFLPLAGGTMTGDIKFSSAQSLHWDNGTYRQKIAITDDSVADTAVFSFQQSSNNGTSYADLMVIKDNGKVVANTFVGNTLQVGANSYGDTLPTSGSAGQLFFQFSDNKYEIPSGGLPGQILMKNSSTDYDISWNTGQFLPLSGGTITGEINTASAGARLFSVNGYHSDTIGNMYGNSAGIQIRECELVGASQSDFKYAPTLGFHWSGRVACSLSLGADGALWLYNNDGNRGAFVAGMVHGAVWNDYAEYRESNITEPGRVIFENGDDTLSLSTERLQRGCEIVSDTFGFAIGETDECKTPIAASGRVLAYPYESREEFTSHIGWPVCSGPNGTVSIMTEEEEEKYPSRIIGTISSIPDYEEWGSGKVKVNGRVWIRIR